MSVIGLDIDGVFADFDDGFRKLLGNMTGRWLIPESVEPPTWNYATFYGYTKDEERAAWDCIRKHSSFWYDLNPYPGAVATLDTLWREFGVQLGHDVYFITTRLGASVKAQTEAWLKNHGFPGATVLIARGSKGPIAEGLRLDYFIDDKTENCLNVFDAIGSRGEVYLLKRAWNNDPIVRDHAQIRCVADLRSFVDDICATEARLLHA